jgi:hypothetical protein
MQSEPEHFIEFAQRVPGWCVVVCLVGGGQEIGEGEETGIHLWRAAVDEATEQGRWVVHAPGSAQSEFDAYPEFHADARLHLGSELRFHTATRLHDFVSGLLGEQQGVDLGALAQDLDVAGYHLRVTRDLETAKDYLRSRYADDVSARFGLVASSRDVDLARFGIRNDYLSTRQVWRDPGPWYGLDEDHPSRRSCRQFRDCATEFLAQGLELDGALLGWGTDYRLHAAAWTIENMYPYGRSTRIHDPFRLRRNAYRVLLTRARDVTVVYVPPTGLLNETYEFLVSSGFTIL